MPSQKEIIVHRLDEYYRIVKWQLLRYQSHTTGLFPRYSDAKETGYIRDSVYCSMACWALSSAYARVDDDRGRFYELGQCAVKTMRGILSCWLRQSDLLEKFKTNPSPINALHSKFDFASGDATYNASDYGHLQVDVVALYLLTLVQMISGGLNIIYTQDEVNFVQNLVFYIERTYRTPDYGIWEAGTRYNDGHCELHASSLGFTKAALEAINGFNLYGSNGTSSSIVYVDIDAHNRNRTTFESLLPRESNSKNTDASLLFVASFPCFASHEEKVRSRVVEKVVRKLQGKYGMKRFLRDGFGTVLIDKKRRFYQPGETKLFDGIECEWPMFFVEMIIDGIFRDDQVQVKKYKELLAPLIIHSAGGAIIPQYYYVIQESILQQRARPHSQRMFANCMESIDEDAAQDTEPPLFLWSQALYIITCLLDEKLLLVGEIDPIYRHMPASQRPKFSNRNSVFQIGRDSGHDGGSINDPVVQLALIAESARLQALLLTYGIQTQTPHQVEPVKIWPPAELVKVFSSLGRNDRLALSGRPARPVGSLGTSKIYRVYGETVFCYPLLMEVSDFYMAADPSVIVDDIKKDIAFVARRWKLAGRPTICMLLREESFTGEQFPLILDLLVALKNGYVGTEGVRCRVGRVQNLLAGSCVEHLDFADPLDPEEIEKKALQEKKSADSNYDSLLDTSANVCVLFTDADFSIEPHLNKSVEQLCQMFQSAPPSHVYTQSIILNRLREMRGFEFTFDNGTVKEKMEAVCHQAGFFKNWSVVRYCAAILRKVVDSLSPSITSLLVRGKHLTIGVVGHSEEVVDKPVLPAEIAERLFRVCLPYDVYAAVLEQELILALANLMSTKPQLFTGTLKLRIGWMIHAMNLLIKFDTQKHAAVHAMSPMEVKELLFDLLSMKHWNKLTPLQQRQLNGALHRVPPDFYDRAWKTLERMPGGVVVAGNLLPQQPTLSDMTEYELNFALTVEELLSKVVHPEYRQIITELFVVLSTVLQRNPELQFANGTVNMDELVRDAVEMFRADKGLSKTEDAIMSFYELPSMAKTGTTAYLARAVVNSLLKGDFSKAAGTTSLFDSTDIDTPCGVM